MAPTPGLYSDVDACRDITITEVRYHTFFLSTGGVSRMTGLLNPKSLVECFAACFFFACLDPYVAGFIR